MLNDDVIKNLIKKNICEDEIDGYYFYGVITATIGKMILLGTLSGFANKFYLVNITNKKIHIYSIDMLGNPKEYSYIPMSEVKNVKISNWMFGIGKKIYIELNNGSLMKLKANMSVMGIKEQKKNITEIERVFSSGRYVD